MHDLSGIAVNRRRFIGSLGCCAVLSACGGGGGGGSGTVQSADPPPATGGSTPGGGGGTAAVAYSWPAYTAVPSFDYGVVALQNPGFSPRADRGGVARRTIRGMICFAEGPNRDPALTDAMVTQMLDRLNADLKIVWETMGFAPDKGFAVNNYINYYLLGSGLDGGNATAPTDIGYQGAELFNGQWWPSVCTSYHAIRKAHDGDALNRSNITHETIHVLQSGTGSFERAGWFHEAHNTQLGARLIELRDGVRQLGFLDAVSALGPHIPIEAFAGWMRDGSFGAPSPEANVSPRDFFGGAQYCGTFPLFLQLFVGSGLNTWLWKNNQPATETVLQTLVRGLGSVQTARAITEYRARVALIDFGAWRAALKAQVDAQFARSDNAMYAATTLSGTTLTPAAETLPGTSGANYIPLSVTGTTASVTFAPGAGGGDLRCQLAYRATDGSAVYGEPVPAGACTVPLTKPPAGGVVTAVVTNVATTHSKTAKFPYSIDLGSGVTPAPRTSPYY